MNYISVLKFPLSFIQTSFLSSKSIFKALWILFFILIISLFTFCIFQVNDLTAKNYQVRNTQKTINELSFENENLEIEFSKVNSLVNIETLIEKFNFQKAAKIHYIQISDNQIVKE